MKRSSKANILPLMCSLLLVLSACSTTQPKVAEKAIERPNFWLDGSLFGEAPKLTPVLQLFQLTESQREDFTNFTKKPKNQNKAPNRIVADYLQRHLENFNYYSETHTAKDSLLKQKGNCLSLAILTKAIAQIMDVQVQYQLVDSTPVYQQEGNIVVSSQHVRTKLLTESTAALQGKISLIPGGIFVDYFPERGSHLLRQVDEKEFYGMYYRNKAAEALLSQNTNYAYWLVRRTLEINPTDPHGLNMMALIYYRKGMNEEAEALYQYGIAVNDDKLDLLSNYLMLLNKLGRVEDAQAVSEEVEKYEAGNPFRWISAANEAYNAREYQLAMRYYLKAQQLAPYLHQPHAGIARVNFQEKQYDRVKNELEKAKNKSNKQDVKSLYQSKLDALQQFIADLSESKRQAN